MLQRVTRRVELGLGVVVGDQREQRHLASRPEFRIERRVLQLDDRQIHLVGIGEDLQILGPAKTRRSVREHLPVPLADLLVRPCPRVFDPEVLRVMADPQHVGAIGDIQLPTPDRIIVFTVGATDGKDLLDRLTVVLLDALAGLLLTALGRKPALQARHCQHRNPCLFRPLDGLRSLLQKRPRPLGPGQRPVGQRRIPQPDQPLFLSAAVFAPDYVHQAIGPLECFFSPLLRDALIAREATLDHFLLDNRNALGFDASRQPVVHEPTGGFFIEIVLCAIPPPGGYLAVPVQHFLRVFLVTRAQFAAEELHGFREKSAGRAPDAFGVHETDNHAFPTYDVPAQHALVALVVLDYRPVIDQLLERGKQHGNVRGNLRPVMGIGHGRDAVDRHQQHERFRMVGHGQLRSGFQPSIGKLAGICLDQRLAGNAVIRGNPLNEIG